MLNGTSEEIFRQAVDLNDGVYPKARHLLTCMLDLYIHADQRIAELSIRWQTASHL